MQVCKGLLRDCIVQKITQKLSLSVAIQHVYPGFQLCPSDDGYGLHAAVVAMALGLAVAMALGLAAAVLAAVVNLVVVLVPRAFRPHSFWSPL